MARKLRKPIEAEGDRATVPAGSWTRAVDGEGCRVVYRKMFLSHTEAERSSPGVEPSMPVVDEWRLGVAECKDTGASSAPQRSLESGLLMHSYWRRRAARSAASHEPPCAESRRAAESLASRLPSNVVRVDTRPNSGVGRPLGRQAR